MIQKLTITNYRRESLELKLSDPWETGLAIGGIDGLGAPSADIRMTEYATLDGALATGTKAGPREITLHFLPIWSRSGESVELARRKIYKYLPIKRLAALQIATENGVREISGYVSAINPEIFEQQESVEVVLKCPDPWFTESRIQVADTNSDVQPNFEFPVELSTVDRIDGDATARLRHRLPLGSPQTGTLDETGYMYAGEWYWLELPRIPEYDIPAQPISFQYNPVGVVKGTRHMAFGPGVDGRAPEINRILFDAFYVDPTYQSPRASNRLDSKAVGDSVWVYYDGQLTECIVVQKGSPSNLYRNADGVWLMFKDTVPGSTVTVSSFPSRGLYPDTELADEDIVVGMRLKAWNPYLATKMLTPKIPYYDIWNDAVLNGTSGEEVDCFSPSFTELGADPRPFPGTNELPMPEVGTRLQYFSDVSETTFERGQRTYTIDWNTDKATADQAYWTRGISRPIGVFNTYELVDADGLPMYQNLYTESHPIRPIFILANDTNVDENGIIANPTNFHYDSAQVRIYNHDSVSGLDTDLCVAQAEPGVHEGAIFFMSQPSGGGTSTNNYGMKPLALDENGNPMSTFTQTVSMRLKDPSDSGHILTDTALDISGYASGDLIDPAIPWGSVSWLLRKQIIDLSAMTGTKYDGAGNPTGTAQLGVGDEIRSIALTVSVTYNPVQRGSNWYIPSPISSDSARSITLTGLVINDLSFDTIVWASDQTHGSAPFLFYGIDIIRSVSLPPASGVMAFADPISSWPLTGDIGPGGPSYSLRLTLDPVMVTPLVEFSFVASGGELLIDYDGDADTYPVFEIKNIGSAAVTSTVSLIVNDSVMEIDCSQISGGLPAGGAIEIQSAPGKKRLVLDRLTNVLNALDRNSKWPSLIQGSNVVSLSSTNNSDHLSLSVKYQNHYQGV